MMTNSTTHELPPADEMFRACADRDARYDGVFVTAVKTTGIFCRPACPARTPRREHVEFFPTVRDALASGYRPCKRCRPLEPPGAPPSWLRDLLTRVEDDPGRRWRDADLRALGLDPTRVRRWFKAHHGMTFHAYQRSRRLGLALARINGGGDTIDTGLDHGFASASGFRDAFVRLFGDPPGRARAAGVTPVAVTRLTTPLGPMIAAASDEGVCLLEFADRRMLETQILRLRRLLAPAAFAPGRHEHLDRLDRQLTEYFDARRTRFDLPLVLRGTPFQTDVWRELLAIPAGETSSYEMIARRVGRPRAVRAVGTANGDNRLAIVVPCHRVVRSDGTLSGYGGGVWRKRRLLELERASVVSS